MPNERLFQIHDLGDSPSFTSIDIVAAHAINVREKSFEEWMARNPRLLFTDENAVLVMAQEISGDPMADILALDSEGSLIIIEAKRGRTD